MRRVVGVIGRAAVALSITQPIHLGRPVCRADGDPAKALLQRFQQFLAESGARLNGQFGIARNVA